MDDGILMKGKRCDGAQPAWGGARRQNSRSSNQARHCSHSAEPCKGISISIFNVEKGKGRVP